MVKRIQPYHDSIVQRGDRYTSQSNVLVWSSVIAIAMITIVIASVSILSSPMSRISSITKDDAPRESYSYDESSEFVEAWNSKDKYKFLVNTPGAPIAGDDNSVARINTDDGQRLWEYKTDNGHLCHMVESNGNITALFDNGKGCTDIITLDASSGHIIGQAQFSVPDDSKEARLSYGRQHIAIVTPHFVRILRDDLVPTAEFGLKKDYANKNDQDVENCNISDVAVGPDHTTVAAQCQGDKTYHVRAIKNDPKESSQGIIDVDVDTASKQPVTTPLVTKSMFNFVTNDVSSSVFTWQLDKEKSEVSNNPVEPGQYSYGYIDMKGIGYVWRVGNTVHVRHGSEDISKSQKHQGAIGNPIQVDSKMIVPHKDSVVIWDPENNKKKDIRAEGLSGKYFAFAGDTLLSLNDDGTLSGFLGK